MTSLDTSAEAMWEELEASRMKIERMYGEHEDMIRRFVGYYYDPGRGSKKELENPGFEMLATMTSQILSGDPFCVVDPQRSDDEFIEQRCIGLQYAGNRLIRNIKLKKTMSKVFVDFFFRKAVLVTERQVQPWADRGPLDGPPYRPNVRRVPPQWFRYDARALDLDERRWSAHPTVTSKGSMLERLKRKDNDEKGWKLDVIEQLESEVDLGKLIAKDGEGLKRDDFILWSVWIPDEQVDEDLTPDMGYWGAWHYYAQTGTGRKKGREKRAPLTEIREPQPCFCARTGPYTTIGQFYVPDESEPMSVMLANEEWARQMGDTSRVLLNQLRDFKRFMVCSGPDPDLPRKIKLVKHGGSVHSKGFDPKFAKDYVTGGMDAATLAAWQWMDGRSKERTGLSESMLGRTSGGSTATAETLAAGGANARIAMFRDTFYDGLGEVCSNLFEMIDGDDQFIMRVPRSAQEHSGVTMQMIQGGRQEGQTFEDYDIRLQPLWMRHKTEEELAIAAEQEFAFWSTFAQIAPVAPFVNWKDVIRDRAVLTQRPNLDARVNYDMLDQVTGMNMAMQVQGAGQTSDRTAKPQSVKDAGARKPVSSVGGPSKSPASPSKGRTLGDKAGRSAGAVAKIGKVG